MTELEFAEDMAYLGMAYGKDYTEAEVRIHYDFLKEYSDETFMAAIKNIIKKSKFLPKITELLEECENCKEQYRSQILDFMNQRGYFKSSIEFEKATKWLETGIVPEWFKNDMNEYAKMLKQDVLGHQETLMIG